MSGKWKIAIGERPLKIFGVRKNPLFQGREVTHSFLVLMDENDQVIEELHGSQYNTLLKGTSGFDIGLARMFAFSAVRVGDVVVPGSRDKLRVFLREPSAKDHPKSKTIYTPVLTGSKSEIETKWSRAIMNGIFINAANFSYVAIGMGIRKFGQNCHSVTQNLLKAAGATEQQIKAALEKLKLARPGFKHDLKFSEFASKFLKTVEDFDSNTLKQMISGLGSPAKSGVSGLSTPSKQQSTKKG